MPVDVEVDAVAVLLGAHAVGEPAEPGQVVAGVEVLAVLAGEPLAGFDLAGKLFFLALVHASRLVGSADFIQGRAELSGPAPHQLVLDADEHPAPWPPQNPPKPAHPSPLRRTRGSPAPRSRRHRAAKAGARGLREQRHFTRDDHQRPVLLQRDGGRSLQQILGQPERNTGDGFGARRGRRSCRRSGRNRSTARQRDRQQARA